MKKYSLLLLALTCMTASAGFAAEVQFPTPAYTGAELAQVRKWEKAWSGKKITAENVDQVKDFVHEGVYKAIKDPSIFGAKSIWFDILPYKPYEVSKGIIEATKKYAPAARLDEKENLVGYGEVAGIAFPQPNTGIEMAWNFNSNTRGDASHVYHKGTVVDSRSGHEREAQQLRWELFWIGRVDVQPVPKFSDAQNPRNISRSFFQRHTAPADFVDTTILELCYKDGREEDLWVYTAMFRRVRRYATNQRTDVIDGTDMIYDDQEGWYTYPTRNTYTAKGRADLLVMRHQDAKNLQREPGQGYWSGFQRERVNNWVVEVVNKEKDYIYGKQIWYLDPENWQMNFKVMYNRKGELWKMYEFGLNEYPSSAGTKAAIINTEHIIDFIRHHGSPATRDVRGVGIDIPLKLFTTRSMQEKSY